MNTELQNLYEWMSINKLSLNIKKTKFMIFSAKKSPEIEDDVLINGHVIEKVEKFKFLGVIIDSHLKWMDHIHHIKKKISKGLGILYKAKRLLNPCTLLTLYYSFMYPYFLYCIEVWGNAANNSLLSLLKLQKRALRLIKSVPIRTTSEPLFKSLELLNVYKLYYFRVGMLMFKMAANKVPKCMHELFKTTTEVHSRLTRQKDKLYLPFTRLEIVKKSIRYKGVTVWNNICDNIQTNCSLYCFKHKLKSYLLQNEISF